MVGFKEPQPRKNSAAEDAKKIIGGNWPPYARQGGEANWNTTTHAENLLLDQIEEKTTPEGWNTPSMVLPDHSPFELRKAALEAACALQGNGPHTLFWKNIETLENYLRDGTKP